MFQIPLNNQKLTIESIRLFPYLRFLKANYSMDYKTFERYFCDPDAEDCNNRIATLLSYAMMRRTMKTTILNRPILRLPDPHPILQLVDFSKEEKIIYRIVSVQAALEHSEY
jgi:hypothetical protein